MFWLEDPVAELQEGFRIVRPHTTTLLAVGGSFQFALGCAPSDWRTIA
jgi:hypothetical protein